MKAQAENHPASGRNAYLYLAKGKSGGEATREKLVISTWWHYIMALRDDRV